MTPESTEGVTSLNGSNGIVTSFLGDQMYGFPILAVNDIIGPHSITRVPLSPPEVAGVLNLRGRIVTAIDMRRRFGKPASEADGEKSSISRKRGPSNAGRWIAKPRLERPAPWIPTTSFAFASIAHWRSIGWSSM